MTSITIPDLLTILYVLVDDWYQQHGVKFLAGKAGQKPTFTDSEVITVVTFLLTKALSALNGRSASSTRPIISFGRQNVATSMFRTRKILTAGYPKSESASKVFSMRFRIPDAISNACWLKLSGVCAPGWWRK